MAKLVAIEGLDGSGKETQTSLLMSHLAERGIDARSISFPRYGKTSAALVEAYLSGEFGPTAGSVNAYGASSFFAMDRFVSYLLEWREAYESCDVLIADRYVTSNAIYQCSKLPRREWDGYVDWLFDYEFDKLMLPRPDRVFYLRVRIDVSQRLIEERHLAGGREKDIHEQDADYLARSREAADWCAKRFCWDVIECSDGSGMRAIDDIHAEIVERLGA